MGGFVLCNKDGQPTKTLSFPHFRRLVRENVIDFPKLTSSEIQERSNLHPVFAFIALLQATWFVSQCVSRFVHSSSTDSVLLATTQLEAITAPLVIVNWCIFIFAWKKPLDPHCPILIKPNVNPGNRGQLPGLPNNHRNIRIGTKPPWIPNHRMPIPTRIPPTICVHHETQTHTTLSHLHLSLANPEYLP